MKIFGKLIKIVLISMMVTGASFASEAGYNFDGQEHDTEATVARLGFVSPTKLSFTKESVEVILDGRFDPCRGRDAETRRRKTFLLRTVEGAFFDPRLGIKSPYETARTDFLKNFQTALEKNKGVIEVELSSTPGAIVYPSAYIENKYPTYNQVERGSSGVFWLAINKILCTPAHEACSSHDGTSIPTVTASATAHSSEAEF